MSTSERRVSPMQVAAQLLEETVCRVQVQADEGVEVQNKEEMASGRP